MKKNYLLFYLFIMPFLFGFLGKPNKNLAIKRGIANRNLQYISDTTLDSYARENFSNLTDQEFYFITNELKNRENKKLFKNSYTTYGNKNDKHKDGKGYYDEIQFKKFNTNVEEFETINSNFIKSYIFDTDYNTIGTCGYVAAGLLLNYYDSCIRDKYQWNGNTSDKNRLENYVIPYKINNIVGNKKHINLIGENNKMTYMITKNFTDYLYEYIGVDKLGKKFWLTNKGMRDVINRHFKEVGISDGKIYASMYKYGMESSLKKYKRPIAVTYVEYDYFIPNTSTFYKSRGISNSHNVLVYGYRKCDDGYWYICHFGWEGEEYTKVYIRGASLGTWGYTYMNHRDDLLINS